ncbi:MAG: glycosyl hydrolase family 18 protein [Candidatus Krumholzibacteria bacterium]|nr:glycosyl hydrolase family 18 protein [Candidatus Krumholzibacteria bacterium]MDP6798120.1 glycosyl hydrolase family 18 protein [Candidatus Krumholzibacteria bacterium]MDP7022290.1 glycosyl hydrolase family 18 protein [Candidatus Krumholzibacteria bacterium]
MAKTRLLMKPVLLLLLCFCLLPIALGAEESIHARELREWKARELSGWQGWQDPQNLPVAPLARSHRNTTHEVHGYHPYWMGNAYEDYDWDLLSTVAFFSLELSSTGDISNNHGWPWTGLVETAHDNGVRVLLTATMFLSWDLTVLLSSASNRSNAISQLVSAVTEGGADGVNVDFEGVAWDQRSNYVLFLQDLRIALDAALPNAYLSVATPAVDWSDAYWYSAIASYSDHLMVMAYDFHYPGSSSTGPVAPLANWGTYNVTWSINDYLNKGVAASKLLLGVPYYGYLWSCANGEPGAPTYGWGTAKTFAEAYPEALNYGLLWDGAGQTSWYRYNSGGWYQCWFEDDRSLTFKYEFAINENLAGIGIWALGYDGSRSELWTALDDAFGTLADAVPLSAQLKLEAWPNPFNPRTRIRVSREEAGPLNLVIHDLQGRSVQDLFHGQAGEVLELDWQAENLPSGVYLLRGSAGGPLFSKKLLLLK